MNLPNKLSLLRVALVPVMVGLCYLPGRAGAWSAGAVFALASFTDYLDGHLARSRNLITDFGKFIDPLADKLLVLSAMIMLVHTRQLPAFVPVLVLARELAVDGLRMMAAGKGQVIAAGKLGKLKTVSQMALILLLFFTQWQAGSNWFTVLLCAWVAVITLWSGVDYFRRNLAVLRDRPEA